MYNKLSQAIIFLVLTLGASFLIFWGPLAVFQVTAISFVSQQAGPWWAILMYVAGGFGPSLVALLLTWRWEGGEGLRRMGRRVIQFKIGWRWYLAAIAVVLCGALGQILIVRLIGQPFDFALFLTQLSSLLPLLVLGPFSEELGWRGYALDRLQSRFTPLVASLLLGAAWAFWHLPLFFMPGTSQHELAIPFVPFLITLLTMSVLFTWLHNHTRASIWTAIFFHWIYTFTSQVVSSGVAQYPSFHWYGMILYVLIAVVVIVLWRPWNEAHPNAMQVQLQG